jgi:hypothetical protein
VFVFYCIDLFNLFVFLFDLSLDILLSHERTVFLRGLPCLFSGSVSGAAVVNCRLIKPHNVVCDKLQVERARKFFQYHSSSV